MALLTRNNTNPGDPPYSSCPKGKGHFGKRVTAVVDKLWSDEYMRRKIQEWFKTSFCPNGHQIDRAQPGKNEGGEGVAYGMCGQVGCGKTCTTWDPPEWFRPALEQARQDDEQEEAMKLKKSGSKRKVTADITSVGIMPISQSGRSLDVVSRSGSLSSSFEVSEQLRAPMASSGNDQAADEYDKYLDDGEDDFYMSFPMPSGGQALATAVEEDPVVGGNLAEDDIAGLDLPSSQLTHVGDFVATSQMSSVTEDDDLDMGVAKSSSDDNLPPSSQLSVGNEIDNFDKPRSSGGLSQGVPPIPFGNAWKKARYGSPSGTSNGKTSERPSTGVKTRSSLSQVVKSQATATAGTAKEIRCIRMVLFTAANKPPFLIHVLVKKTQQTLKMVDRLYETFGIKRSEVLLWYNRRINGFEEYTGGNLLRVGQEHCVILRLATLRDPGLLCISGDLAIMESGLPQPLEKYEMSL